MDKSYFKVFFSKIKERKWLDKMGDEGYLLVKIRDSKYCFTHSPEHKYKYSIEYLDVSPQSDDALEYFNSRESEGIKPVLASGNWVYFVKTDGRIVSDSEIYKKNASFYFWRMLYLFFFAVSGAVLCGYQFYATKYLPYIGHESDGRIGLFKISENTSSVFTEMLNVIKLWINTILEFLNNTYLKLFSNLFGNNDASVVLAFLIPVVLTLAVLFALNFEQYMSFRVLVNNRKSSVKSKPIFKKPFGRK